jgi:hypothetical protein
MRRNQAGTLRKVDNWTIRPVLLCLLAGILLVLLLVQVLPQVDLPDTAFQRETAPATVHSQATAPPTFQVSLGSPSPLPQVTVVSQQRPEADFPLEATESFPVLHRSLRC